MVLLPVDAQAQSNACDQLKGVLAARIDATGVSGYSLETVPAGSPVPPGAKAVGTCESGASKILYRRWAVVQPSPADAGTTGQQASAPQPAAVAPAQTRRPPDTTPRPAPRAHAAASADPPGRREPEKPIGASAIESVALAAADRVDSAPEQSVAPPSSETIAAEVAPGNRASEFALEYWRWLVALVVLPLAWWIWLWHAHRSAYDEAGLPRGPKL